jgi:acetylornithine/N-succinyldiaminopimelate aminotransferase
MLTTTSSVQELYGQYVLPTYGRFPIILERGLGCRVWDENGVAYLDFGAGIAVCAIGHSHPRLVAAIAEQAARLIHTSNLYYTLPQGHLAKRLAGYMGTPGQLFFCNSGGEANEGLIKLAHKYGYATGTQRYEIITFHGSFHGRTMGGISATAQEKVKVGFGPLVPGFRHIPINDVPALLAAINEKTVAVLIEPIQGEGGINLAAADFLRKLRFICDEHDLLLMFDEVQCGLGRTGDWCGWKTLTQDDLMPDAISWAKGIAGGFPMGSFWVRHKTMTLADGSVSDLVDLYGPGTHGTTFGGTPLACAAANAVFDVIEEEHLLENATRIGEYALRKLRSLVSPYISEVRGTGLMIGIELVPDLPQRLGETAKTSSQILVHLLHEQRQLAIPAGPNVVRWLPPLNVTSAEIDQAVDQLIAALACLHTRLQA